MPEAVETIAQYLFDKVNLDFLVCGHFVENDRSRRVQEKCGFHHVKQAKYITQYGEVKDEWLSIREK